MDELSPLTRALRVGLEADVTHGAVVPPIYLTTNFAFQGFGEARTYDYSRSGNPTRDQLGEALATLEGAAGAVVTASGMAATTLVLSRLLEPGQLLAVPHDCYGGSWRLFDALSRKGHFRLEILDFTDPAAVAALWTRRPAAVWLETPSNPLLRVTDIGAVSAAAHAQGAKVVVDNTFCSPVLQRPLELGADVVVHSTTKYLNGHSDVVGGAVLAGDPELAAELSWWGNTLGVTGSPFDSYLTLRGIRTLGPRMRAHLENAAAVVEALGSHEAVRALHYPGLPTHPGHALAARQQSGFGAMVSFELADEAAVRRFLTGLRCFSLAESLGGVESLVCHPATMTHAAMPPELQAAAGITSGLLRLSVGIEQADDLVADVRAGLDRARG